MHTCIYIRKKATDMIRRENDECMQESLAEPTLFLVEESQLLAQRSELVARLLLNQIEAHRDERQPEEDVEGAEDELLLPRPAVEARARHVVAEADGRQRDEAEVGADQVVPVVLPQREQHGAAEDVARDEDQTDVDGHANVLVVLRFHHPTDAALPVDADRVLGGGRGRRGGCHVVALHDLVVSVLFARQRVVQLAVLRLVALELHRRRLVEEPARTADAADAAANVFVEETAAGRHEAAQVGER